MSHIANKTKDCDTITAKKKLISSSSNRVVQTRHETGQKYDYKSQGQGVNVWQQSKQWLCSYLIFANVMFKEAQYIK